MIWYRNNNFEDENLIGLVIYYFIISTPVIHGDKIYNRNYNEITMVDYNIWS